jgi:hypothetical protein
MVFAWERGLYPGGMKPRESKQMSWALIQLHLFDVQLRDMVQEDIRVYRVGHTESLNMITGG